MAQRINFEGLDENIETLNKGNSLDYYKNIPKWNKLHYEMGDYKEILKYLESGNSNVKTLNYSNAIYIGELVNGKENGVGILEWTTGDDKGTKRIGCWIDGEINGYLVTIWTDGDKLEGNMNSGELNGIATTYWANGKRKQGNYVNGKEEGRFIIYYPDGSYSEANFRDGKQISDAIKRTADGKKLFWNFLWEGSNAFIVFILTFIKGILALFFPVGTILLIVWWIIWYSDN